MTFERPNPNMPRLNLDLTIKNFGPIENASISLKPLTIFIGPNNSGKSYAAILIHSIISSYDIRHHGIRLDKPPRRFYHRLYDDKTQSYFDKLAHIIMKTKDREVAIPREIINAMHKFEYNNTFKHLLPQKIEYNFASSIKDLIRDGQKSMSVKLSSRSDRIKIGYDGGKLLMSRRAGTGIKHRISLKPQKKRLGDPVQTKADGSISYNLGALRPRIRHTYVRLELLDSIVHHMNPDIPSGSYYFPSARSGMMQSHRVISASMIRSAPYGGIKPVQIPQLSGVVADFVSSVIEMPDRPRFFAHLAKNLEEDLLAGSLKRQSTSKHGIPSIIYRHAGMDSDIPLHRTSSTVSEMAPLVLYLRHVAAPGDAVIIEEPEAHLHPANQLILAKYLTRLIRGGLNILITTHSVFLLEQLGTYLKAGSLTASERNKMDFGKEDYLNLDEISAYEFSDACDDGGTAVRPIKTSQDEGIAQDEFVKINDTLYDQIVSMDKIKAADTK